MGRQTVLVLEYDGTRYHGFQRQANARTIQYEVESALSIINEQDVRIKGASRTDAGVHAKWQVVSFISEKRLESETWVKAINAYLPSDISVRFAYEVSEELDVRRDAVERCYSYTIVNRATRSPLRSRFAHLIPHTLDISSMNLACESILGNRDFAPFSPPTNRNTTRTVYAARFTEWQDLLVFSIRANAYLLHQVRNIVGGLIKVGLGKMTKNEFEELAKSGCAGVVGPAVPAKGLCLTKIRYSNLP
ncbi:MAG: tRNA pseudouridine(38-40) synthase TruA [Chloroflexota bacterium]|nr:tRNA pseudouridine(38-40) synthase TruA [Chloroflexota bacterium]